MTGEPAPPPADAMPTAGLSVSDCADPGGRPPFHPAAFAAWPHVDPQNGWPVATGLLQQNAHIPGGAVGEVTAAAGGPGVTAIGVVAIGVATALAIGVATALATGCLGVTGELMPDALALVAHPLPQYGCPGCTALTPQNPHNADAWPAVGPATVTEVIACPGAG